MELCNNGHTWDPAFCPLWRGCPLSECIYKGTFRLSFVERFVLFQSVLHRRFHGNTALKQGLAKMSQVVG